MKKYKKLFKEGSGLTSIRDIHKNLGKALVDIINGLDGLNGLNDEKHPSADEISKIIEEMLGISKKLQKFYNTPGIWLRGRLSHN